MFYFGPNGLRKQLMHSSPYAGKPSQSEGHLAAPWAALQLTTISQDSTELSLHLIIWVHVQRTALMWRGKKACEFYKGISDRDLLFCFNNVTDRQPTAWCQMTGPHPQDLLHSTTSLVPCPWRLSSQRGEDYCWKWNTLSYAGAAAWEEAIPCGTSLPWWRLTPWVYLQSPHL